MRNLQTSGPTSDFTCNFLRSFVSYLPLPLLSSSRPSRRRWPCDSGMLPTAVRLSDTAFQTVKTRLKSALKPLWQDKTSGQLGLAISGGVDSMALASLCSEVNRETNKSLFTGFIVDHGAREGSSEEAKNVADELDRLGIRPKVLKLDWSAHKDSKGGSNFETLARKLRYPALGEACYHAGIRKLLVAHHADDQAETLLVRIANSYMGAGLAGTKWKANIPGCNGIYGVDNSGASPSVWSSVIAEAVTKSTKGMAIEQGGVSIYRPLLPFTKEQLIAVCREAGVKWFEDHTNADKSLTLRNTVRHLSKQEVLPAALQRERLLQMAEKLEKRNLEVERQATELFDAMHITLNLRLGKVTLAIPSRRAAQYEYRVQAAAVQKVLALVSPQVDISLQDLDTAMHFVFVKTLAEDKPRDSCSFAGVLVYREHMDGQSTTSEQEWDHLTITRGPPPRQHIAEPQKLIPTNYEAATSTTWSKWQLWDGRYWIRVGHLGKNFADEGLSFIVRFLTPDRMGDLRNSLTNEQSKALNKKVVEAGKERWTMPAIVAETEEREEIVILPTVNWKRERWNVTGSSELQRWLQRWTWEIRYKHVEFEETERHKIVS